MKKFLSALLLGCGLLSLASSALAQRTPDPIVDYPAIRYTPASGKTLDAAAVSAAIKRAGSSLQWRFSDGASAQQMVGTLVVRQHTIQINIAIAPASYSVSYRDSINMNYSKSGLSQTDETLRGFRPPEYFTDREKPVIHPNYNRWVKDLVNAINREISTL